MKKEHLTLGESYYYKEKYNDLQIKYADLNELCGERQAIIEAYGRNWNNRTSTLWK